MRKVHYKVVLDIFAIEDNNASGLDTLESIEFVLENTSTDLNDDIDIQNITIESIEVTDSR